MKQITSELTGYDPDTAETFSIEIVGHLDRTYVTVHSEGNPWFEIDGYALFKALSYTELVDEKEA